MNTIMDQYLKQPYTRILIPNDDGTYSAEILEFSGCFADGNTPNEAIENLTKAAESWIEVCLEQGLEIPQPFENQDFGGKIALRLPRSLHRQAVRFAKRDGISLNQFLVSAIAEKVGSQDSHLRRINRFGQIFSTQTQGSIYKWLFSYDFQSFLENKDIVKYSTKDLYYLPINQTTERS